MRFINHQQVIRAIVMPDAHDGRPPAYFLGHEDNDPSAYGRRAAAGIPSNISGGRNVGSGQHSARLVDQLSPMGEPDGFASIPYQVFHGLTATPNE